MEANLAGVILKDTIFNEKTTLPDGTKWALDIDMTRFTDRDHPGFWRSNELYSPAHRSHARRVSIALKASG